MDAIPFRKADGFIPSFPTVILGLKSAAFGTSLYTPRLFIFLEFGSTRICARIFWALSNCI